MTKEEAILWLKVINTKEFGWDEFALQESQREIRERCEQGVREAIDMAIEALSSAEIPTESTNTPTNTPTDLISREDAIEAVRYLIYDRQEKGAKPFKWWFIKQRLNAIPSAEAEWIPCSERLPKENEYVGNVCKYYLIQDEYGDMHVAHLSSHGWETIESVKALGCDVVAWMPLPKPYKGGDDK